MKAAPEGPVAIVDAPVLGMFGDFITTDHISPAGAIAPEAPAADYLRAAGVDDADFNTYGSRRGNHEVMMRGTFGNVKLQNALADGRKGGYTRNRELRTHPSVEPHRHGHTAAAVCRRAERADAGA